MDAPEFNDPVNMAAANAINDRVQRVLAAELRDWPDLLRRIRFTSIYNIAIEEVAKVRKPAEARP